MLEGLHQAKCKDSRSQTQEDSHRVRRYRQQTLDVEDLERSIRVGLRTKGNGQLVYDSQARSWSLLYSQASLLIKGTTMLLLRY